MTRTILQAHGYTVLEAPDARATLALWESAGGKIDLVLTDVIIPGGLAGAELVERLRRDRPGLKALLMSGYPGEVATYEKGLRLGDRILIKPFGPLTLARVPCGSASRGVRSRWVEASCGGPGRLCGAASPAAAVRLDQGGHPADGVGQGAPPPAVALVTRVRLRFAPARQSPIAHRRPPGPDASAAFAHWIVPAAHFLC